MASPAKDGLAGQSIPIDWQAEQATCPEDHTSINWTPAIDKRKNEVITIKFSIKDCHACPSRSLVRARLATPIAPSRFDVSCTTRRYCRHERVRRPRNSKRSMLAVPGWGERFRKRVRALGLRRSRSIGQEKTHLQHLATAAAMNIVRVVRWLDGKPHTQTRRSALVQLLLPASEK